MTSSAAASAFVIPACRRELKDVEGRLGADRANVLDAAGNVRSIASARLEPSDSAAVCAVDLADLRVSPSAWLHVTFRMAQELR